MCVCVCFFKRKLKSLSIHCESDIVLDLQLIVSEQHVAIHLCSIELECCFRIDCQMNWMHVEYTMSCTSECISSEKKNNNDQTQQLLEFNEYTLLLWFVFFFRFVFHKFVLNHTTLTRVLFGVVLSWIVLLLQLTTWNVSVVRWWTLSVKRNRLDINPKRYRPANS